MKQHRTQNTVAEHPRRWKWGAAVAVIVVVGIAVAVIGAQGFLHRRPQAVPATPKTVSATNDFAYRSATAYLSDASLLNRQGNANYSPVSMWMALALASHGADGSTLAQMNDVLDNQALADEDYRSLMLSINGKRATGESAMQMDNSLWADKSVKPGTDFVKLAKRDFNAQTISADFRDAKTAQRMSDWIGKHTKGMLRPEITIGRDEVMSVINTVYADGRWASPFESAQTTDARFHGTTDDHMVAMMHQSLELDGADGDGWHRADLPFDDGSRLKILLPDANRFESMCQDESTLRTAFEAPARSATTNLSLPRFTIDSDFNSDATLAVLRKLGMRDAFSRNAADFTKLTQNSVPLYISSVIQGTRIAVNEVGAKAGAYTKVGLSATSAPANPREFKVDRPFLYEYASPDGVPLFIGVVRNL